MQIVILSLLLLQLFESVHAYSFKKIFVYTSKNKNKNTQIIDESEEYLWKTMLPMKKIISPNYFKPNSTSENIWFYLDNEFRKQQQQEEDEKNKKFYHDENDKDDSCSVSCYL